MRPSPMSQESEQPGEPRTKDPAAQAMRAKVKPENCIRSADICRRAQRVSAKVRRAKRVEKEKAAKKLAAQVGG